MQVLVRRATLSLDSDLEPDSDLLVRAASGAVWLWEFPLADRLAAAATLAGGAANAKLIRAYALSCTGRGEQADALLADIQADELADAVYGRAAFLRATNRLFTMADPVGAKELIDDASRAAGPQARSCIDAFLLRCTGRRWASRTRPSSHPRNSPGGATRPRRSASDRLGPCPCVRRSGPRRRSRSSGKGRLPSSDTLVRHHHRRPHRRPTSLAGHIDDADAPAQTIRQRQIEFQAFQSFQVGSLAVGRVALGSGRLEAAISMLTQCIETVNASTASNGWGYRCQIPLTTALAMRGSTDEAAARLGTLKSCAIPAGDTSTTSTRSPRRGWPPAGAVSEAIAIPLLPPKQPGESAIRS